MKNKFTLILIFTSLICMSQEPWVVPKDAKEKLSPVVFDDDFIQSGSSIYNSACMSCHGTPGNANFALMIPSPGDPADEQFQSRTDGELYYKILKGRSTMPKFEDVLSEEEIWGLVAYIRSYHPNYEQQVKVPEGMIDHNFKIKYEFDHNIDKLVIKVYSDDTPLPGTAVTAYIKSMFGKLLLGKTKTNELGIAYVDVDSKIPGDEKGNLTFLVRVSRDYASKKEEVLLPVVKPTKKKSAIEGRHLWSTNKKAPIWLIVTFWTAFIGIWLCIIYVVFNIRKLKKYA